MSLGSKCLESKCRWGASIAGEQVSREQMSGEHHSWIRHLFIGKIKIFFWENRTQMFSEMEKNTTVIFFLIRGEIKMRWRRNLQEILFLHCLWNFSTEFVIFSMLKQYFSHFVQYVHNFLVSQIRIINTKSVVVPYQTRIYIELFHQKTSYYWIS